MTTEGLIITARLWDEAALVEQARNWIEFEGRFFLSMKGSQVRALERAVAPAKGSEEFIRELRAFAKSAVKRAKGREPWTPGNGESLCLAFLDALEVVQVSTTGAGIAFVNCCEILASSGGDTGPVSLTRDSAILRAFLAALVMIQRCGFKEA